MGFDNGSPSICFSFIVCVDVTPTQQDSLLQCLFIFEKTHSKMSLGRKTQNVNIHVCRLASLPDVEALGTFASH